MPKSAVKRGALDGIRTSMWLGIGIITGVTGLNWWLYGLLILWGLIIDDKLKDAYNLSLITDALKLHKEINDDR